MGTACANYGNGSCCDWSAPLTVKYCTDSDDVPFFAYKLSPPPQCEMAYCSGDKMPCVDGEGWDEASDTCVGKTFMYMVAINIFTNLNLWV